MHARPLVDHAARGARSVIRSAALPGTAIAAGSTLLVCLPSAPGLAGALGLFGAALAALAGSLAIWAAIPQLMVVVIPTLLFTRLVGLIFPWEIALSVFAVAIALHGRRRRESWLWRLSPIECWLLLFTGWALFTALWSTSSLYYLLGMRRLLCAVCVLWVATRLPHVVSRRWFNIGIACGASSIALAAIQRSLTTGFSATQTLLHRAEVTNLGWGTANYVATLLLLCAPTLLRLVLRGVPAERVLGVFAFALVIVVEFMVASRAATVLFIVGSIVQLLHATRRFRVWVGFLALGIVAALIASPLGTGLLSRLGSVRELGSLTIRIWYFREGFWRLVEHLPWGMGLGQGYANPDRLHGIDPHNYWLLIGGDLGIPGLVLWAAVLIVMWRGWLAARTDAPSRELAFTILLTFALGNLHTLVEPTFQGGQYQLLFLWIVCGTLAYAQTDRARAAEPLAGGEPARAPAREPAPAASGA